MRVSTWVWMAGLAGCFGATPAPWDTEDTGPDADTDTDTDLDTATDTGDPDDPCRDPVVTFAPQGGAEQDVTSFFTSGDYLTLAVPGTLSICPGTWFSRVLLRADVSVVGLGTAPAQTVLSGGESGTILDISGPDVLVTVDNVTFDRGAGLDVEHNSGGGGIYCEQDGTVFVQNAIFTNNFANDGAAIYGQSCAFDLTAVSMRDNFSEDDGGAMTLWYSTAQLQQVDFVDNEGLDGGAMAMFESSVQASQTTFDRNLAGNFAGGLWVFDSDIRFTDVAFRDNDNQGSQYGGGMIVHGTAVLDRVTFDGNEAPRGGGLFVYYEAVVDGNDCDFSGNSPDDIYVADNSSAGGVSIDAGSGYSFSCSDNSCSEK